eukprot:snap_masked-scaffold_83-processed-gene-0.13-mRNA-1 protein AED:1.00 eAED:1.00 QI:0/-1/0/0/-1/1/1/0/164
MKKRGKKKTQEELSVPLTPSSSGNDKSSEDEEALRIVVDSFVDKKREKLEKKLVTAGRSIKKNIKSRVESCMKEFYEIDCEMSLVLYEKEMKKRKVELQKVLDNLHQSEQLLQKKEDEINVFKKKFKEKKSQFFLQWDTTSKAFLDRILQENEQISTQLRAATN